MQPTKKILNYVYAVIWVIFFGNIGVYAASSQVDTYSERKGSGMAAILSVLKAAIGGPGVFLIFLAIGLAMAAWCIFGKDDD